MMIDVDSLPKVSAIYRVWHRDRVIYVGQTINLQKRWQQHHILPKLISRHGLNWTIDWVEVEPCHLNRAEAFAYRCFAPELNQRNPSERLGT